MGMRGRRRCVNAVEFQSSDAGGSREHDDLRSDSRVNVDRSPKRRRRITGTGRAVRLNGPLVPAHGTNRD
jgi:hypothetical protein